MNQTTPLTADEIKKLRTGKPLILVAILINLGALPVRLGTYDHGLVIAGAIFTLIAYTLSIFGIIYMTAGLRYQVWLRVVLCIVTLFPFVSLIVPIFLAYKSTKALAENEIGA